MAFFASVTIGNAATFVENTAQSDGGEHRINVRVPNERSGYSSGCMKTMLHTQLGTTSLCVIRDKHALRQHNQQLNKRAGGSDMLRPGGATLILPAGQQAISLSNRSAERDSCHGYCLIHLHASSRAGFPALKMCVIQHSHRSCTPVFLSGAIHVVDATFATEQETVFEGNTAVIGAGGGVYCSKSVATFNGSSFTGNSAVWGGGEFVPERQC